MNFSRSFLFAAAVSLMVELSSPTNVHADQVDVWIGCPSTSNGMEAGIYHARLNVDKGKLTQPKRVAHIKGAGFLAMHPNGNFLYSLGGKSGPPSVSAFKVTGKGDQAALEFLNSVVIGDGGAAHLSVDRTGTKLLSAQYGGGSTAIYSIGDDGTIIEQLSLVKHEGGSGVVPRRQDSPHAHWSGVSPDNRFAFVPDLGMDKVVIWDISGDEPLKLHGHGQCVAGGGPRHMKFSPDGKLIYVLNELSLSVTTFSYDAEAGSMTAVDTVPTLSEQTKAKETFNSASEIRVHPSGKFVFAANRGNDSITAFRSEAGKLSLVEVEPIRGGWPRNFDLDPTGHWLIAAGQQSNTLTLFSINQDTGELTFVRETKFAPGPICVMIQ